MKYRLTAREQLRGRKWPVGTAEGTVLVFQGTSVIETDEDLSLWIENGLIKVVEEEPLKATAKKPDPPAKTEPKPEPEEVNEAPEEAPEEPEEAPKRTKKRTTRTIRKTK